MKKGIHPEYKPVTATCVCGNSFITGSTKPSLKVEICAKCHPFYTGQQKIVDTEGRVERFIKKYQRKKEEQERLEEEKRKLKEMEILEAEKKQPTKIAGKPISKKTISKKKKK